jgi:ABC-type lipoprotein release transport system permease subunit
MMDHSLLQGNAALTVAAATFLLIVTAALACYVPALRAIMVTLTEALRQE